MGFPLIPGRRAAALAPSRTPVAASIVLNASALQVQAPTSGLDGGEAGTIALEPASFSFVAAEGVAGPEAQTLTITNTGETDLTALAVAPSGGPVSWLVLGEPSATTLAPGESATCRVAVDHHALSGGTYNVTLSVTATNASNSPATAPVSLTVEEATVPSLSIALGTPTATVSQGASVDVTVTVTRGGGWTGDVAVTIEGAATGVTAGALTILAAATSGTLTLSAAADATVGADALTVRATGTGVGDATATLTLTVEDDAAAELLSVAMRSYRVEGAADTTERCQVTLPLPASGAGSLTAALAETHVTVLDANGVEVAAHSAPLLGADGNPIYHWANAVDADGAYTAAAADRTVQSVRVQWDVTHGTSETEEWTIVLGQERTQSTTAEAMSFIDNRILVEVDPDDPRFLRLTQDFVHQIGYEAAPRIYPAGLRIAAAPSPTAQAAGHHVVSLIADRSTPGTLLFGWGFNGNLPSWCHVGGIAFDLTGSATYGTDNLTTAGFTQTALTVDRNAYPVFQTDALPVLPPAYALPVDRAETGFVAADYLTGTQFMGPQETRAATEALGGELALTSRSQTALCLKHWNRIGAAAARSGANYNNARIWWDEWARSGEPRYWVMAAAISHFNPRAAWGTSTIAGIGGSSWFGDSWHLVPTYYVTGAPVLLTYADQISQWAYWFRRNHNYVDTRGVERANEAVAAGLMLGITTAPATTPAGANVYDSPEHLLVSELEVIEANTTVDGQLPQFLNDPATTNARGYQHDQRDFPMKAFYIGILASQYARTLRFVRQKMTAANLQSWAGSPVTLADFSSRTRALMVAHEQYLAEGDPFDGEAVNTQGANAYPMWEGVRSWQSGEPAGKWPEQNAYAYVEHDVFWHDTSTTANDRWNWDGAEWADAGSVQARSETTGYAVYEQRHFWNIGPFSGHTPSNGGRADPVLGGMHAEALAYLHETETDPYRQSMWFHLLWWTTSLARHASVTASHTTDQQLNDAAASASQSTTVNGSVVYGMIYTADVKQFAEARSGGEVAFPVLRSHPSRPSYQNP